MLLMQHAQEGTVCWPGAAVFYEGLVRGAMSDRIDEHFRLYWIENAHHIPIPRSMITSPAPSTRLIDYGGGAAQSVSHVMDWVERGVEPPASSS
jgi:hypothetical protein